MQCGKCFNWGRLIMHTNNVFVPLITFQMPWPPTKGWSKCDKFYCVYVIILFKKHQKWSLNISHVILAWAHTDQKVINTFNKPRVATKFVFTSDSLTPHVEVSLSGSNLTGSLILSRSLRGASGLTPTSDFCSSLLELPHSEHCLSTHTTDMSGLSWDKTLC